MKFKPFLTGVWVLIGCAVFRIVQLWFLYNFLLKRGINTAAYEVFSFLNLIIVILPLLEAFIYWRLRFDNPQKRWAHRHVWILFLAVVLLPLLMFVLTPFMVIKYPASEHPDLYPLINKINYWTFWFLFSLAHIFFIVTIVKYFKRKNEVTENETPAGLLDEFVS